MPRKLVISQYVSLDGVIEDPVGMEGSGLGDWTGPFKRGAEGDVFKIAELFAADAVLLGRVTYDAFAPLAEVTPIPQNQTSSSSTKQ